MVVVHEEFFFSIETSAEQLQLLVCSQLFEVALSLFIQLPNKPIAISADIDVFFFDVLSANAA